MQDPSEFRVDPTVEEGGTIVVQAPKYLEFVYVFVPGRGSLAIPVVAGRAEYTLPPEVLGGTLIVVSDGQIPNPKSVTVTVVGGESP